MGTVSETLIFSLVDAGCLVLFLLYSRCFFSCEKLLRKEEAQRWLEGLKGVVMALSLLLLFAVVRMESGVVVHRRGGPDRPVDAVPVRREIFWGEKGLGTFQCCT